MAVLVALREKRQLAISSWQLAKPLDAVAGLTVQISPNTLPPSMPTRAFVPAHCQDWGRRSLLPRGRKFFNLTQLQLYFPLTVAVWEDSAVELLSLLTPPAGIFSPKQFGFGTVCRQ